MSTANYSRVLAASIQQSAKDSGLSVAAYLEREERHVESVAAMRESTARAKRDRILHEAYCAAINAQTGQLDSEEYEAVRRHLSETKSE